jgi:hypothetical protein
MPSRTGKLTSAILRRSNSRVPVAVVMKTWVRDQLRDLTDELAASALANGTPTLPDQLENDVWVVASWSASRTPTERFTAPRTVRVALRGLGQ